MSAWISSTSLSSVKSIPSMSSLPKSSISSSNLDKISSLSSSDNSFKLNEDSTMLITYLMSSEVIPWSVSKVLIFWVNLPVSFWIVLNVTCSSSPISGDSTSIVASISTSASGSIPISPISISISGLGDGGKAGEGTAGGAEGTSAAGVGIESAAGLGVFNVNLFCSPYKETPSSFSLILFNSPATKFNLLNAWEYEE